jgi:Nuclear pore assembly and biogenesis
MAPAANPSTLSAIFTNLYTIYLDNVFPYLPAPLQQVSDTVDHTLTPILAPVFASGDIVSLAAFLLCLYLTLRIADYIRRSIFSWFYFLVKIGLVLLVIQAVFYVQAYGLQKALRDAGWLGGIVWGFVEETYNQSGAAREDRSYGSRGYRGGRDGKGWNMSGGRQQVPVNARRGRWV